MNETSNLDVMVNEDGTANWDIAIYGPIAGEYEGRFVFRCYLTPEQHMAADRRIRQLLGPNSPEMAGSHARSLAVSLAELEQRIEEAPLWWRPTEAGAVPGIHIQDHEVILHIFTAATEAEDRFRELLAKRRESARKKIREQLEKEAAPADDSQEEG